MPNSGEAENRGWLGRWRASGCLFSLVTVFLSMVLFGVNNALVQTMYTWLSMSGPDWLSQRATAQFIMFFAPVALLFAQWWILELLLHRFRSRRRP